MLAIERRSEIFSLLEREKSVLVPELSKKYNVTEETIRRDLDRLEKDGLAKKTYGGAVLRENMSVDPSFRMRAKTNKLQKQAIAAKVFDLIEDNDNLMLDASSTSVIIAKKLLEKRNLTIITNSVEILLDYVNCKGCKVISTGGELRESSLSLVGKNAEKVIENFFVDKVILSCNGIHMSKGITESSISEMEVKRAMLARGKEVILAADLSKFDRLSFVKLAELRSVNYIVCEKAPPPEWIEFLEKENIKIL